MSENPKNEALEPSPQPEMSAPAEPQAGEAAALEQTGSESAPTRGGGPGGGRRGGGGGRDRGGDRGRQGRGRGGDFSADTGGIEDQVVRVYRCATVVKGGRRFSFGALVVVGDRNGRVGIGYGKANEVPNAVEKATKFARRSMVRIKMDGTTIPHQVQGRHGASKVTIIPAGEGTGVIAGASVRAVLELAGIKNVLTKSYGSTSPKNLVKAAFEGLQSLRSKEEVAKLREVAAG